MFLMVDDMRRDELRYMPQTRRWLGRGGATFTNAVMPNPLCCPSRASVLTGLHAHNHQVWSHAAPWGFHSFDDRSTFATWLRGAGYTTSYLGKYLNGYGPQPPPGASTGKSVQYVPPGWSQWRGSIDGGLRRTHRANGSTYRFFDTTLNNNGNGYLSLEGEYQSAAYGRMTASSITRLAAAPAPFLSYVSFTAPHNGGPRESDDPTAPVFSNWAGEYQRLGTPARPTHVRGMFDAAIKQAPGRAWHRVEPTDLRPSYYAQPPVTDVEWDALRNLARQRAESLAVVDKAIGRIMGSLRDSGEMGRTLVIFTSDNGFFLGERRMRHGKSHPYGPSARVPLLMRGPGIPAAVVREDPYLSIDHAATVAAAAGVSPPYVTDGQSMLRVARRGDAGWRRPVLTESAPAVAGDPPSVQGIRTSRYLYLRWAGSQEELFDVKADRMERHNVLGVPEYADDLAKLRGALEQVQNCRGAACSPPLDAGLVG